MHLVGNEPHCPTASWSLVHEAVHIAKHIDQDLHVGPIVSSDLFYNPDEGQYERWSERGVLAVEMEAAALFTVAAIRGVEAGCLLTVSDIVVEGVFTRITDEELRAAVDRMTRLRSLDVRDRRDVAFARRERDTACVFLVNPASANGSTGKSWPQLRRRARRSSASTARRCSPSGPGHLTELAREAAADGASCSSSSAATGR